MKTIIAWMFDFILAIRWCGRNPLEYKRLREFKSIQQQQEESQQLDREADEFLKQVGNRFPDQWTFGESAWYESIRRREATI